MQKTVCDFCGKEIANKDEHWNVRYSVQWLNGDLLFPYVKDLDACKECAMKFKKEHGCE